MEPFRGHLSSKVVEIFKKRLLIEGSKGLAWFRCRFRAKREQFKIFKGLEPESQGQILALFFLYVPSLLDSGAAPLDVYLFFVPLLSEKGTA